MKGSTWIHATGKRATKLCKTHGHDTVTETDHSITVCTRTGKAKGLTVRLALGGRPVRSAYLGTKVYSQSSNRSPSPMRIASCKSWCCLSASTVRAAAPLSLPSASPLGPALAFQQRRAAAWTQEESAWHTIQWPVGSRSGSARSAPEP